MPQEWMNFPPLPEAYPLSTDTVLLSDFISLPTRGKICDLGAGVGTLSLLLAARFPGCVFDGIELQEDTAEAAPAVIAENGMADRVHVRQGDIREVKPLFPAGSFDAAVSNPPYFSAGSGFSASGRRGTCRSEETCSFPELCACADFLLKYGGWFSFVHRPERLPFLLAELTAHKLEPKRLQFVKKNYQAEPSLVLIAAKKGGHAGLQILPDFVLSNLDGTPSDDYLRVYRIGGN